MRSVLVLDGERSSTLAIVRSLGRKGLRVDVGSRAKHAIAASSKFCSDQFEYPDPLLNVPGFQNTILNRVRQYAYSLVIPVTDETIFPLMGIRQSVEARSPLAMSSNDGISIAASKSRTCELAATLGIPLPKTYVIRNIDDLTTAKHQLSYPVIIKPDVSRAWSPDGKGHRLSVRHGFDEEQLKEVISGFLSFGPVVLQELVFGEGVGLGILASQGQVIFAFQYRMLHEVPVTGGVSSYTISERLDTTLLNYASFLMKALRWDGVAQIDFMRQRNTGELFLIEVNGRFWASLPLPIVAGADFPWYLVDMMLDHRRNFTPSYKIGVRCRNLLLELAWLKGALWAKRRANKILWYPSYPSILIDCLRFFNPMEHWDTLDLRDPLPAITDIHNISSHILIRMHTWARNISTEAQ